MKERSTRRMGGAQVMGVVGMISMLVSTAAVADSIISVNWSGDTRADMGATEVAGAPGVRVSNWNTILKDEGVLVNPIYADGTTATGVTIAPSDTGFINRGNSPSAGDEKLFNGVKDVTGSYSIGVTGLTFAVYDVYVYQRGESENRGGGFTIGSTTYYARGLAANPTDDTGYVLSTDEDISGGTVADQMAQGNYVKFSGLTGSDFTLNVQAYGDDITRSKIAGLQIVAVPEPATLGLVGLAGLGLLFARRFRM